MNRVMVFDNQSSRGPLIKNIGILTEKINDFAEQHKIINISVVSQKDDLLQAFVLYEESEE